MTLERENELKRAEARLEAQKAERIALANGAVVKVTWIFGFHGGPYKAQTSYHSAEEFFKKAPSK